MISHCSSNVYRGIILLFKMIRNQLGVRFVLEGHIRESNGEFRVTAQLIDTETGVDSIGNDIENIFSCPTANPLAADLESCLGGDNGAGFGWHDVPGYRLVMRSKERVDLAADD